MADIIQSFVKDNKDLFEQIVVNDERKNYNDGNVYSILDYKRILGLMKEYLAGYIAYKSKKEDTYESTKVLEKTKKFYDSIFTEDGYRRKFKLPEMVDINKDYLILSNELRQLIDTAQKEKDQDRELTTFLQLTENQYKKLSKVYKDDMNIWLWLSYLKDCSEDLKKAFRDKGTPVIHKV